MITDGKNWHYLALKSVRRFDGEKWYNRPIRSLSRLLRGKTSNHNGDFYCLNCFHSYSQYFIHNPLKKHDSLCNKHDHCYPEMPTENNKILKYNHGKNSLKAPFTIYADLERLLLKSISCQNNLKKSYTKRKAKHKPSGYS